MKSIIRWFFAFCILGLVPLFAGENCHCSNFILCEKTYIQEEQLVIHEGIILIQANETAYRTSAVYSDNNGLFIKDYAHGCANDEWWCPKCEQCNKTYYFLCPSCSKVNWKQ